VLHSSEAEGVKVNKQKQMLVPEVYSDTGTGGNKSPPPTPTTLTGKEKTIGVNSQLGGCPNST